MRTCQSRLKLLSHKVSVSSSNLVLVILTHVMRAPPRRGNASKPRVLRSERKGCVPRFLSSSELGSVGCILSSSSNETLAQEVSEKQKTKSSSLISDDVRRHSSSGIALKGRRRRLEGGATKPRSINIDQLTSHASWRTCGRFGGDIRPRRATR